MQKILVVDDEQMMLMLAKRVLSQEYEVVTAKSGEEGLSVFEREQPDMIISDLLMPEMGGFEMYEIIQKKYAKHVPIIFMTSDDSDEAEGKGFASGASDFLIKPFRPAALLRRVDNALGNEERIRNLTEEATMDEMTGLLNKASVNKQLEELCRTESGVLMMIDLDSFKLVNDLHGHDMGDRVICRFAELIKNNIRQGDVSGRIGGDEFILFCVGCSDESMVKTIAERLNDSIFASAKEYIGEEMNIPLGASVGAVFVSEKDNDYSELFKKADKALYSVKQRGKHGYAIYSTEMDKAAPSADIKSLSMLFEERSILDGAFFLGQEAFSNVYRFLVRFIRSYSKTAYKHTEYAFTEATDKFGELISQMLRKSDIMVRIRENQYFLLLPEIGTNDIDALISRLLNEWSDTDCSTSAVVSFEKELISAPSSDHNDRQGDDR